MTKVLNVAGSGPRGVCARRAPEELSLALQRSMLRMKGEFMDAEGRGVDYEGLQISKVFNEYVSLTEELVECDISCLGEEERKAFFISIL